ncbi:MAG TPA: hypothetical protein VHN99_00145 [Deinococcales bacterium]|nr:hypothetical protein [Deinococcales bacterium]
MSLYLFALLLGLIGLASMALLGLNHAHDAASAGHSAAGHVHDSGSLPGHDAGGLHGHEAAAGHATIHAGHGAEHAGHDGGAHDGHDLAGGRLASEVLALASPRVLFSIAAGFGAAGQALSPLLGSATLPVALVAGWAFERFLVRPYWNALFAFASKPAGLLEGAVLSRAEAVTDFDAEGNGLVAVEVDGELTQVLGTLTLSERNLGVSARRGDLLRVLSVDAGSGRCVVSRLE